MERKYRDATALEIGACQKVTDDSLILKQIAYNLAHIADELAEANEWNRDIWEECNGINFNTAEMCGKEPCIEEYKTENEEPEPQDDKKNCFICGKEIELKDGCYDDGGCIITSEGDLFLACPKCKHRFDALIQHFVMPNEVFC